MKLAMLLISMLLLATSVEGRPPLDAAFAIAALKCVQKCKNRYCKPTGNYWKWLKCVNQGNYRRKCNSWCLDQLEA